MRKTALVTISVAFILALAAGPSAALGSPPDGKGDGKSKVLDPAGIERLQRSTGNNARVTVSRATGAARFVSIAPGAPGDLMAVSAQPALQKSSAFLNEYASIFGLRNADAELRLSQEQTDGDGGKHLTFAQVYQDVPVFAGVVKTHFNKHGELTAVNGEVVPEINLDVRPYRSVSEAGAAALARVGEAQESDKSLSVQSTQLLVYRTGLAQGIEGRNHLAWQVEVGNGSDVREFVYVDAHTGKVIDQITGIIDALYRRAYDAQGLTAPGPNYPALPFWVEGQIPFPTGTLEADNMIYASGETYNMFSGAFSRDSFDGAGAIMDAIFNRGNGCPNASWNGLFISFCPGTTSDDVTAHEWGHAYTQYTHNLIYQWQPGALNESYSDIWGEVVDLINGRQTDSPGGLRTDGSCTAFTRLAGELVINSPAGIAGTYLAQAAQFGPNLTPTGTTGNVVLALDPAVPGSPSPTDGCSPLTNAAAVAGNIALIDRGTCQFSAKVYNAQLAGAIGVIIANNSATGLPGMGAGLNAALVTIPSLGVELATGNSIKANLAGGVNSTLRAKFTGAIDNSYRWLIGEDATAFGGAIRDMWSPTCYGHPGKVSDVQYTCGTGDNGGVHSNSGVPNHAFALIVDGGTYNGQTITGLGQNKAAHIYFRAMTVYQHPATDFPDHADAIEQSASDLIGLSLDDLSTGLPSGESITAADVTEVKQAMLAVEMRTPPTQCNFQPLLAQSPPALCGPGTTSSQIFKDNFEDLASSAERWTVSHLAVTPADFTERDWEIVSDLPDDRAGNAFFGVDPNIGTCAPGGDESGVLYLVSKKISLPTSAAAPRLTFVHWVATEAGWDGGNLKISVNGGPWQLIQPGDFIYNAYNTTLFSAAQGNTNPMAGETAFSGTDGGSVDGSWGRSIVNLTPYAHANDKIQLRFDLGTDGCGGLFGWYVDDVLVYRCK